MSIDYNVSPNGLRIETYPKGLLESELESAIKDLTKQGPPGPK